MGFREKPTEFSVKISIHNFTIWNFTSYRFRIEEDSSISNTPMWNHTILKVSICPLLTLNVFNFKLYNSAASRVILNNHRFIYRVWVWICLIRLIRYLTSHHYFLLKWCRSEIYFLIENWNVLTWNLAKSFNWNSDFKFTNYSIEFILSE